MANFWSLLGKQPGLDIWKKGSIFFPNFRSLESGLYRELRVGKEPHKNELENCRSCLTLWAENEA